MLALLLPEGGTRGEKKEAKRSKYVLLKIIFPVLIPRMKLYEQVPF